MIKSRPLQIVYRAIYLILMVLAIADSLGAFSGIPNPSFYVYYTNQSNYICTLVALFELIFGIVMVAKGKKQGTESPLSALKFLSAVWILITCGVYNVLLGDITDPSYWNDFSNVILHLVGPILFILDFILFTKPRSIKLHDTALVVVYPYLYVIFILVRAVLIDPNSTDVLYPYFFLDAGAEGYAYVFIYVLALSAVFIALALLFTLINHLTGRREKKVLL